MKELTIEGFFKEAVAIGLKNMLAIIVNAILWVLTIWIPYLNVGTTIAMTNLAAKMSRDEGLEMTEIFKPEYRKFMGEYFIVLMMSFMGMYLAALFFLVPAFVLQVAWSLATLLVLDKGMEPMAALKKSNELTYGKKWTIFLGKTLLTAVFFVVVGILVAIGNAIHEILAVLFVIVGMLMFYPISAGADAYVYKTLARDA
jgi:hypothetical protein